MPFPFSVQLHRMIFILVDEEKLLTNSTKNNMCRKIQTEQRMP